MYITTPELEGMLDKSVEFVIQHRTTNTFSKIDGKCFVGWTKEEIRNTFYHAALHRAFLICTDSFGNTLGVVHGVVDENKKLFHVSNILTLPHSGAMKSFIHMFDILWPEYKLQGNRFGKLKQYDTLKFKRRVMKNAI